MNWIKISKYFCNEIDQINKNFQDKNKEGDEGSDAIPTIVWDKICRLKCEVSLGIRQKDDLNSSFFAKQGWKILTQLNNIWVQLMEATFSKLTQVF